MGQAAPEWQLQSWVNSPPLTLASLRGQPVLVRFWTTGCPFCRAVAPALNELHRELGPRGLRVVGVYHPQPAPAAVSHETVAQAAQRLGFAGRVAWIHPGGAYSADEAATLRRRCQELLAAK